jgi:hypothetical protein
MTKANSINQKALSGKAGEIFKKMPPRHHTLPGQQYRNDLSEVYDWIRDQEDIMHWLMMKAYRAEVIKYDPVLEMWHGTEYFDHPEVTSRDVT